MSVSGSAWGLNLRPLGPDLLGDRAPARADPGQEDVEAGSGCAGVVEARPRAARGAVGGLTIGLAALAGLALWSTASTAEATDTVGRLDAVGNRWAQVLLHVSDEAEALSDFTREGNETGDQPLESATGSAEKDLQWLRTNGGAWDVNVATGMDSSYRAYTTTVRQLIDEARHGRRAQAYLLADEASLSASTLRKQSVVNVTRQQLEMTAYLQQVDGRTRRIRVAEAVILAVDALLLLLSALVLLNHQRRIERQAVESHRRSLHDGLTSLANRVLLTERMEQALREAPRTGESIALLLLDLDRFKEVNDTLGHHHGDLLLCEVAARLTSLVRGADTVARLGGDEFAVLLRQVGTPEAAAPWPSGCARQLQRPATLDGTAVLVGGSVGVALHPEHGGDRDRTAPARRHRHVRGEAGPARRDALRAENAVDDPGLRAALAGELRAGDRQR